MRSDLLALAPGVAIFFQESTTPADTITAAASAIAATPRAPGVGGSVKDIPAASAVTAAPPASVAPAVAPADVAAPSPGYVTLCFW